MQNDTSGQAVNWAGALRDVFTTGISAVVDSQAMRNFNANDPRYNTAGGVAGRGQFVLTPGATVPPGLMLGIAVVGVVLFLALRK